MREDLLKKYIDSLRESSKATCSTKARAFLQWLGNREPTSDEIQKWVAHRQRQGYVSATVRNEWGIICRLYRVNGIPCDLKRGDAPVVSEEDTFAPAIDTADIRSMVRIARELEPAMNDVKPDDRHRCFLLLSTMWGLRREELSSMQPEDIDPDSSLIHVRTVHMGRNRWHWVPEDLMPIITAWGFQEKLNAFDMSMLFTDLKLAIDFPMKDYIGWHGIRRSLVMGLVAAGLDIAAVHRFMRWKRSSTDMAMRYSTSQIVSRDGTKRELVIDERKNDEAVLARHPFIEFWREK